MEKRNKLAISLLIIAALVATYFIYNPFTLVDKKVIPVKFFVAANPGLDLSPEYFGFGAIQPGMSSARKMDVKNEFDRRIFVTLEAKGEIKDVLVAKENNFYLEPGEEKQVGFTLYTQGLTEYREYNGELIILSRKA